VSEVIRIGHKGAGLIEPGNTVASFQAALDHGVDMIEFDVLPDPDGGLWLSHDPVDLASRTAMTFEEGLHLFASEAYAGVRLNVDLKWHGYEDRVADGLRRHGLTDRSLVSTMHGRSLRRMREIAPEIRVGRSVPKLMRNPMDRWRTKPIGVGVYLWAQSFQPRLLTLELRTGAIDAVMVHFALVTRRFARAVLDAGGELYVWTVDDADRIRALTALKVTGVITNDPRLFSPPGPRTSPH
jgi:glycerophosphoryl diester phosphodiesterase